MLKDKKSPSNNLIFVDQHWGKMDQDDILKARDKFQLIYNNVRPTAGFLGKDMYRPMYFRIHDGDQVISKHFSEWTLDEVHRLHNQYKKKGGRPRWFGHGASGGTAQGASTSATDQTSGTSNASGAAAATDAMPGTQSSDSVASANVTPTSNVDVAKTNTQL